MDYLIGGGLVWLMSGVLTLLSICAPVNDEGSWESPKALVCFVIVVLGPVSGSITIKMSNEALFEMWVEEEERRARDN